MKTTATSASSPLNSLINECLNKAPGARPSAKDIRNRLANFSGTPLAPGLARLQLAHQRTVVVQAEAQTRASQAKSDSELRIQLFDDAQRGLGLIADELLLVHPTQLPEEQILRNWRA